MPERLAELIQQKLQTGGDAYFILETDVELEDAEYCLAGLAKLRLGGLLPAYDVADELDEVGSCRCPQVLCLNEPMYHGRRSG